MTLAETTLDYFIAHLINDYLSLAHETWMGLTDRTATEESAALDLPDTLQRYTMDLGKTPVFPCLLTAAREASGNTAARRKIEVSVILMTWLKATDAGAAEVTEQLTRAESAALQVAVETRLRDHDALNAWLSDLDTNRRDGWTIMGPIILANASPERDATRHTIHFATTLTLNIALARRAA